MTQATLALLGGAAFLGLTLLWAVVPQLQRRRGRPLPAPRRARAEAHGPEALPRTAAPLPPAGPDGRLPVTLRNGARLGNGSQATPYLCQLGLSGLPALSLPVRRGGEGLPGYEVSLLGRRLARGNLVALREDLGTVLAGLLRGGQLPAHLLAPEGVAAAWPIYAAGEGWELPVPEGPLLRAEALPELLAEAHAYLRALGAPRWTLYRVDPQTLALEAPQAMVRATGGEAVPEAIFEPGEAALQGLADRAPVAAEGLAPELRRSLLEEGRPSGQRLLGEPDGRAVEALRWRSLLVAVEDGRACLARDLWELRDVLARAWECPPERVVPACVSAPGSNPMSILQEA